MTPNRAYLDHNASSALRPAARDAMIAAMHACGNPSSIHGEGRAARATIEGARAQVATLVGAEKDAVVFTGSATEAAHLALTPDITSDGTPRPASHLYVLATEHPCVLEGGRFKASQISEIPVLANGVVDEAAFDAMLDAHDTAQGVPYMALQLVNSESGVIQPVAKLAQKVRLKGGYTLCDAVQAAGRMPIDVAELGVDFLMLSAHKLGGPQGIGALVIAHQVLDIPSAIRGGGQEKNRRAGTENVAAIAGFGAAAAEAAQNAADYAQITQLRDSIEGMLIPICTKQDLAEDRIEVFGQSAPRIGNTLLFSVRGLKAETALIAFDLDGVAVSSGSACSSGKVGRSHVLEAMGVDEEIARGAIRVSLGWNSTQADVAHFERAFERITRRLAEMVGRDEQQEISGAA
ncbi:cysteine desulfurase family protein [Pseudahrensia aquimaris]|uniref:Cysteine desulfurase n=1 Tax=Pseudahrensia aquimaris TaxID=744461 RepID=A0ABW3FFB4_9HYPH